MKKIILLILVLITSTVALKAQKFGYIDTEFITSRMTDYQNAQTDIENVTTKWVKEIADKNAEVEKLEKAYRAEEVLLTEEMKQTRLRTIAEKSKEARDYQNKVFGISGELIKKKQDLMKPILDEIAKAVERVVRLKRLDFVFDKSSDNVTMIYTNPQHDYTDYVMEELGISPDQIKEKEEAEKEEKEKQETDKAEPKNEKPAGSKKTKKNN